MFHGAKAGVGIVEAGQVSSAREGGARTERDVREKRVAAGRPEGCPHFSGLTVASCRHRERVKTLVSPSGQRAAAVGTALETRRCLVQPAMVEMAFAGLRCMGGQAGLHLVVFLVM